MPTPPAAPCTSSRSPTVSPAWVKSASWAVVKTSGTPPAAVQSSSSGTGIAVRSWTTANSAWPPPATIAITRSPGSKRPTRRPQATTSPASSRPGDVGGHARRRRIVAGELQHVGAVEPGGADADEQLAVLGLGIGVIGDLDPAVDDGGGTHARRGYSPFGGGRRDPQIGYKVDVGVPASALPPALARKSRRGRSGRAVPQLGLARRRRARRRGTPGPADPRLPGRRRLAGDDDPLAARERLPHAPRRNPRQRRLLGGRRASGSSSGSSASRSESGERVAIIGQSRGGIFARVLAGAPARPRERDRHARLADRQPAAARTRSCSPRSSLVGALGTGRVPGMFRDELPARRVLQATSATTSPPTFPPEVGFTALYSRTDGVVDWRACLDPAAEQIEVRASHVGMGAERRGLRRGRQRARRRSRRAMCVGRIGGLARRHLRPSTGEPPPSTVTTTREPRPACAARSRVTIVRRVVADARTRVRLSVRRPSPTLSRTRQRVRAGDRADREALAGAQRRACAA